ncbi:hypothetical protein D3C85_1425910 [compost metagenome]
MYAGFGQPAMHLDAGDAGHLDIGDHAIHLGRTAGVQERRGGVEKDDFPPQGANQARCGDPDRVIVVDDGQ